MGVWDIFAPKQNFGERWLFGGYNKRARPHGCALLARLPLHYLFTYNLFKNEKQIL